MTDGFIELNAADLHDLRGALDNWVTDLDFSEGFRALCAEASLAIAASDYADESTHPPVQAALDRFMAAANDEDRRMRELSMLFCELDSCQDATGWRRILGDLLPILSDAQVMGLRCLMQDIAADFRPGVC